MVRDFDDNEFPLAYLISFRTYGTWLHGDERGSVNRKQNNYGTPRIAPNPRLQKAERKLLKHPPVTLDGYQRPVVEKAIREVCEHRGYKLLAINVRTTMYIPSYRPRSNQSQYCRHFRLMQQGNCVRQVCWLVMLSHGHDMAVRRICGRRNTWNEQ